MIYNDIVSDFLFNLSYFGCGAFECLPCSGGHNWRTNAEIYGSKYKLIPVAGKRSSWGLCGFEYNFCMHWFIFFSLFYFCFETLIAISGWGSRFCLRKSTWSSPISVWKSNQMFLFHIFLFSVLSLKDFFFFFHCTETRKRKRKLNLAWNINWKSKMDQVPLCLNFKDNIVMPSQFECVSQDF